MTTAFFTDSRTHIHTEPGHVEHAGRLVAILQRLTDAGMLERLHAIAPEPVTDAQLLTVHTPEYVDWLAEMALSSNGTTIGGDTYVLPESPFVARLAAGAALGAVDAVLGGSANNALVAMRPPGHHALPDRPMGFCLLANVALAARHAQTQYGVERVMIVDYDVHHGNGTQAIFYDDPGVLFVSTHRLPFYPGTGRKDETGAGAGLGTTLNIPLRPGHGDPSFAAIYDDVVWPAARRFAPQLILVSAGFDAHWQDPLGGLTLTLDGYAALHRALVGMADELCGGRIVFVLEGGYSLPVLAEGVLDVARALLGEAAYPDPLVMPDRAIRRRKMAGSVTGLLRQIRTLHDL